MKIAWILLTVLVWVVTGCASAPDSGKSQFDETPDQPGEPETIEKLAPIDRVEILVAESFPQQYFLLVESGLPNGCFVFDRYEMTRDGVTIRIAIVNQETVGMVCTELYGMVEHNIPLGSDFKPGTTYTVLVNDITKTFLAEGTASTPDESLISIIDQAKDDLSERLGIAASAINLVDAETVSWPDASLGCPQPGMAYLQVPQDGALIILQVERILYAYHSGGSRGVFLCEKGAKEPYVLPQFDITNLTPATPDNGIPPDEDQ